MHIQKVLLLLTLFLSFAIGQVPRNESLQFIQNFRKYFHANIQDAPFQFFDQNYTSLDLYVTHSTRKRPKALQLEDINPKQFFDTTALHQQTQLGFFGYTAVKKEQLIFHRKLNSLYVLYLSEYMNEESESRHLLECTKINQRISYYSIVGNRDFSLEEIKRAEYLCAQF